LTEFEHRSKSQYRPNYASLSAPNVQHDMNDEAGLIRYSDYATNRKLGNTVRMSAAENFCLPRNVQTDSWARQFSYKLQSATISTRVGTAERESDRSPSSIALLKYTRVIPPFHPYVTMMWCPEAPYSNSSLHRVSPNCLLSSDITTAKTNVSKYSTQGRMQSIRDLIFSVSFQICITSTQN
jgi:hypothetical protein